MTNKIVEPCTLDPHQEALRELYDALDELVVSQDIKAVKSMDMYFDYERRKAIAWQKAKEVIQKYKSIKE